MMRKAGAQNKKRPVRESESAFSQRAIKKGHVLQHVPRLVVSNRRLLDPGLRQLATPAAQMDSQQRPVISKFRSDTQGTTSTTTELTISGFPRICKSTLHFVASVVRIPRACGSSSRIRLPPDAFGARPGRTLPDCRDELRHFLPPAALSRARRSLRRFEWTPNSGFRLSRPSVGRTAFISAT